MKYENIKSLILTILVLTSLVLTWNLWTYQPAFDYTGNEKLLKEVKISSKQEVGNIIRPAQMIFHYEEIHYGTTDSQEISRLAKEMEKWSIYDVNATSMYIEEKDFTSFMHGVGKMEIIFPDKIPLPTLRYLTDFSDEEIPNLTIDRMMIDLNSEADRAEPIIYLVNYQDRRVYSAKVHSMSIATLKNVFYQTAVRYSEYAAIKAEESRFIFVPKDPVEMMKMHYLSDTINPEDFKDALFDVPSVVTKDQMTSGEVYTDSSRIMSVDRSYSLLQFVNTIAADMSNAADFNVIERSIEFVNEHSGWTKDKFLFAHWNQSESAHESAIFRLYVGDYPVFNREGLTEITQVWRNNEMYSYSRPIFELGVPIYNVQQNVLLPSASETEQELLALPNFDIKKLRDIKIGYELKRDLANPNQVVFILEPIWVYQYGDSWNKVIFSEKDELGGM
ncbi:YycH family regulatory protein [Sutcliffiella halmapala]|uniref:YycH family regulatory protein n=1 Tax=Sutcliffiella halmapala TaxID=79882 RepID=UPI00147568FC|nr:two-component system activity regulator YycH [Sutcliffiella halmapala]